MIRFSFPLILSSWLGFSFNFVLRNSCGISISLTMREFGVIIFGDFYFASDYKNGDSF